MSPPSPRRNRFRNTLKHGVETALCASGLPAVLRRRPGARRVILAYHNVVPDDAPRFGDRSLHLPLSSFVEQIERLSSTHELVPLPQVVDPAPRHRPLAAVTFDDAYRGAVRLALPELVERGIPATVFVAPAFVGGRSFWWDDLSDGDGLRDELRETALGGELKGQDGAIRRHCEAGGEGQAPNDWTAADETELGDASSLPGITLGSHSWSHPDLSSLAPDELERELRDPLAWLEDRYESAIPWLSYPYGRTSTEVGRMASDVGYQGGLLISGGPFGPRSALRHALPRVNVPAGVTVRGLELRAAGVVS